MVQEDKKTSDNYEKSVMEAKGTNPNLTSKIDWLNTKWQSERYQQMSEEASLMHSILFSPAKPIHSAVVADNLAYFKANYKYDPETIELFLMEACLCGSRNITEYLLQELKLSYKDRPNLLAYITASMDIEWAKEVAFTLVKEELPMPNDVFRLADGLAVETIVNIFESNKPSTLKPSV